MSSETPANERLLPAEWREQWSLELARPLADPKAASSIVMLVFRLGAEWFSLPASAAVEVTHMPAIHRVPHRGRGNGVVNVRGRITACVDIGSLLDPIEKTSEPRGHDRLIVLKHQDWLFAIRVDAVDGVHRLELRTLEPPPPPVDAKRFTTGFWTLAGRSVARLDEQRLFAAAREALA